jgi:hypothetical protein
VVCKMTTRHADADADAGDVATKNACPLIARFEIIRPHIVTSF